MRTEEIKVISQVTDAGQQKESTRGILGMPFLYIGCITEYRFDVFKLSAYRQCEVTRVAFQSAECRNS